MSTLPTFLVEYDTLYVYLRVMVRYAWVDVRDADFRGRTNILHWTRARLLTVDASAAMMMTSSVDAQCFERAAAAAAMYVCDHVTVTIAPPWTFAPRKSPTRTSALWLALAFGLYCLGLRLGQLTLELGLKLLRLGYG